MRRAGALSVGADYAQDGAGSIGENAAVAGFGAKFRVWRVEPDAEVVFRLSMGSGERRPRRLPRRRPSVPSPPAAAPAADRRSPSGDGPWPLGRRILSEARGSPRRGLSGTPSDIVNLGGDCLNDFPKLVTLQSDSLHNTCVTHPAPARSAPRAGPVAGPSREGNPPLNSSRPARPRPR